MSDKVAIVTGGGQGIGAGIAERLAHDGYAVIVNGRTKSKLDSVVAHITAPGGQLQLLVFLQYYPPNQSQH